MKIRTETLLLIAILAAVEIQADTYSFGMGANQFSMGFVNVGHAGNIGETQDYGIYGGVRTFGSVGYTYQMGKFEVTIDQFLKARNSDFRIGNGAMNENYWNNGIRTVGINAPATFADFEEAAKFSNWLTSGDARYGAYQIGGHETGYAVMGIDRSTAITTYGMVFVVPTEDEWYKAAYFKSDGSGYTTYAHGDIVPDIETDANYGGLGGVYDSPWMVGTGTPENNGTYDMDGNVSEWLESPSSPPPPVKLSAKSVAVYLKEVKSSCALRFGLATPSASLNISAFESPSFPSHQAFFC